MAAVVAGRLPHGKADTFVFDLDGVLYVDGQRIPGADVALRRLSEAGRRLLFVTNNSTRSREAAAEHIAELCDFHPDPAAVFTSGTATAALLAGEPGPALVVGTWDLAATIEHAGIPVTPDWREAAIVVVGLDPHLTYDTLREATLALERGARFVATNADPTFPGRDGTYPGAGAVVAALATASGREPEVCGKPNPPMRSLVREAATGDVVVVGDRPGTDLAMAKEEGWASVLVLTGVVASPDQVPKSLEPDVILASIADLPGLAGL